MGIKYIIKRPLDIDNPYVDGKNDWIQKIVSKIDELLPNEEATIINFGKDSNYRMRIIKSSEYKPYDNYENNKVFMQIKDDNQIKKTVYKEDVNISNGDLFEELSNLWRN